MPRTKIDKTIDEAERPRNIKNIYVHKINSLLKVSRESLAEEDMRLCGAGLEKEYGLPWM